MKTVRKNVIVYTIVLILLFGFAGAFSYIQSQSSKKSTQTQKKKIETIATVMIDPGHGGYDGGSINVDGTYEKDLTLKLALELGKQFKKINPGIRVVYTRTSDDVSWPSDEVSDLQARVDMAKEQNVDYFISIHINSVDDPSCYGYCSFVRFNDEASQQIAQLIADNLDQDGWDYNRGTETTDQYPLHVIDKQEIPALLFEAGFGSNPTEIKDLEKVKNQKRIGKAIAKAYNQYITEKQED